MQHRQAATLVLAAGTAFTEVPWVSNFGSSARPKVMGNGDVTGFDTNLTVGPSSHGNSINCFQFAKPFAGDCRLQASFEPIDNWIVALRWT